MMTRLPPYSRGGAAHGARGSVACPGGNAGALPQPLHDFRRDRSDRSESVLLHAETLHEHGRDVTRKNQEPFR